MLRFPTWFAPAMRESWREGYGLAQLRGDVFGGLTVGIVAIPLSMALAIAVGAPPQHGLYTAIVAGILIALFGGSRVNISGPTAAFVVILLPITHQFGLGGLLIATLMAGMILVAMGLTGLGKLVEYIPYPVTSGFTAGIGVVIASLQLKDFLGLEVTDSGGHFVHKLTVLFAALPSAHWQDCAVGVVALVILLGWPRLKLPIPAPLVALLVTAAGAWLGQQLGWDFHPATIGDQFHYDIQGQTGAGIPPFPPRFLLPWELPGPDGAPIGLSFHLVETLLGSAFAIAMLGAIESLLCAVVADGMTGHRHNPNAELIGQGIGNIVAPFFGGISATAAIARTATNIRTGGVSPIASIIHALVVLTVILAIAPLLAYLPMAALAALLMIVAWNMSEAPHFVRLLRISPASDVGVLLTCFGLTVLFDMVLAVSVGMGLAALLFIKRMSDLSGAELLDQEQHAHLEKLPAHVAVYDVNGPLFFGAAEKAMRTLQVVNPRVKTVILDMSDVPMIDITGMMALESLIAGLRRDHIAVVFAALRPRLRAKMERAGIHEIPGQLDFSATVQAAAKLG